MGFTGSTGGEESQHEILSFIASDSAITSAVCCTSDTDCTGSPLGPLCDPVKQVCGMCAPSNTKACTTPKTACDVGAANNMCIVPCTANYGSVTAGACPSASAPFCVLAGPTAGSCEACNGNYGSGATLACPDPGAPSCNVSGFCGLCTSNADCTATCTVETRTCAPCNGDAGSATTSACQAGNSPYCSALGICGSCATDADCAVGTHPGPYCNTKLGACGTSCSKDSQCGTGNWCNDPAGTGGQCVPIIAKGQPLPPNITCTPALAMRACANGACGANNSCAECLTDSDCSSGMVCQSNACQTPVITPVPTTNPQYALSGGGFGGCNTAGSAAGAGGLAWFAALLVLGALTVLRRQRARS